MKEKKLASEIIAVSCGPAKSEVILHRYLFCCVSHLTREDSQIDFATGNVFFTFFFLGGGGVHTRAFLKFYQ